GLRMLWHGHRGVDHVGEGVAQADYQVVVGVYLDPLELLPFAQLVVVEERLQIVRCQTVRNQRRVVRQADLDVVGELRVVRTESVSTARSKGHIRHALVQRREGGLVDGSDRNNDRVGERRGADVKRRAVERQVLCLPGGYEK